MKEVFGLLESLLKMRGNVVVSHQMCMVVRIYRFPRYEPYISHQGMRILKNFLP